jgi:acarbose 7IV-phosphotransferase
MAAILVSGLINMETTLKVEGFPLPYFPVTYPFFGVNTSVSGVGFNLARALTTLGDRVNLLGLIGRDLAGEQVRVVLQRCAIADRYVLARVEQTAQSVILYDPSGRRQIHVDLKDLQDQVYPYAAFDEAAAGCDLLALCNINFSRALLARAKALGVPVACDVHALSRLEDDYNADFMAAADILFMSHEALPASPEDFAHQVMERYPAQVLVIGLGGEGALLAVRQDGFLGRFPAVRTRGVVNAIGAGDALFSAFLHCYAAGADPTLALRKAIVFASYKIGAASASDGFLDDAELAEWWRRVNHGLSGG